MFSRKRDRDATDDVDSLHLEKKLRSSAGPEPSIVSSASAVFLPDTPVTESSNPMFLRENLSSTMSAASSPGSDVDMDISPGYRTTFSHSPEQPSSSSWKLRSSPARNPRMAVNDQGDRVPTPIINAAIRPQPLPVQVAGAQGLHSVLPSAASRNHLGYTMERFPSPISEDEPHTPTTAAGSQLSLLTVTDVDMDMEATEPPGQQEPVTVRKQRQRSGAFTSPREATKKFSTGYREDCEKCRNKVPGHMNHFLGP